MKLIRLLAGATLALSVMAPSVFAATITIDTGIAVYEVDDGNGGTGQAPTVSPHQNWYGGADNSPGALSGDNSWIGAFGVTDGAQKVAIGTYTFTTIVTLGIGQTGSITGFLGVDNQVSFESELGGGVDTTLLAASGDQDAFRNLHAFEITGLQEGDNLITFSVLNDDNGGDNPMGFLVTGSTVNAVPVPAAAWLFGSALLGLAGVKRKKA